MFKTIFKKPSTFEVHFYGYKYISEKNVKTMKTSYCSF